MPTPKNKLSDGISSKFANQILRDQFGELLQSEGTRQRITAVVADYVGSVEFMKKVKDYAGEEISRRIHGLLWTILVALVGSLTTALILYFVPKVLASVGI